MNKEIRNVVFDLFGTLIYLADETKPYLKLFLELDIPLQERSLARRIALTEDFNNLAGLVERIKPGAKIDLQRYEDEVSKEADSARLYPETKEVLEELRDRNIKLGLISNLASPYKKPFFDLGLNDYFDYTIFSCEVGLIKPDYEIYQKIVQEMEIDPLHTLMTGDKIHADVDGPKSIGMNAVHLDRKSENDSTEKINDLRGIFKYL